MLALFLLIWMVFATVMIIGLTISINNHKEKIKALDEILVGVLVREDKKEK